MQTLEDVYAWIPIGAIIDNEILVIHGGISESTDLNLLHRIERNRVRSNICMNLYQGPIMQYVPLFMYYLDLYLVVILTLKWLV